MARRPDDVVVVLRMSKEQRERINRAFGRGNVNAVTVRLLLDHAARLELQALQLTKEDAA